MNSWILTSLVVCFVGAMVSAVHSQAAIEDCCLAYNGNIGLSVLKYVRHYLIQEVTGSCNLPAVIFVFRRKRLMVCGNPKDEWVKTGMRFLDARKKKTYLDSIRRTPPRTVSHPERKKRNPRRFRPRVSTSGDRSRVSKRNATASS